MMHANLHDTVVGSVLGFDYGFLLHKSKAYKTSSIRSQFELRDFTLFKTFGTSIATGCLGMVVINSLGYAPIRIKPTYTWGNLIGGAVVGAGTYLAGSSLEAALGQLGANKRRAGWAIAGGLTGALAYGMLDTTIRGSFLGDGGKALALHTLLDLPFAYVAVPFAGVVAGVLYLMEQMSPSPRMKETSTKNESFMEKSISCLQKESWSPYICGALIGLLQLPTAILEGNAFGIASPYFSTAAMIAGTIGVSNVFFTLYKTPYVYWTFPLDIGAALGSMTSAQITKKTAPKKTKIPLTTTQQLTTFAGCFMVAMGSGMAMGSPSVHGLSGVSQLSVGSMIAMLGVVGGGCLTAQLLHDKRLDI